MIKSLKVEYAYNHDLQINFYFKNSYDPKVFYII